LTKQFLISYIPSPSNLTAPFAPSFSPIGRPSSERTNCVEDSLAPLDPNQYSSPKRTTPLVQDDEEAR
ncbi:hypothetical protein KCU73_g100, partial [Aureobasidium melanogenum]